MDTQIRELVTSYITAVGQRRLEALPPLLEPDAEFIFGDTTLRGADAFVGGFKRLMPIVVRNDIRKIFVDGDEACVVYDFVTDTPAGAVVCFEHLKVRNGRIASSLLVFEQLHWAEVRAAIAERAARQAAPA